MARVEVRTDERGVTRVALNRPEKANALDRTLVDTLRATLARLNSNTRVLVLEGRGESFCAGADLPALLAAAEGAGDVAADATALGELLETLDTLPVPSVARVHGAALGAGAGLVACCDVAVASERALFGFPAARLGLVPAAVAPYVVRAIGPRAARHHFLAAERFDALEAYRVGLVHDICSDAVLDHRVTEHVERLLAGGPRALAAAKRLVADVAGRPVDAALREDAAGRLAALCDGEEARTALRAYLAPRGDGEA